MYMEDGKDALKLAEDLAKNVLGLSATTALAVIGQSEKEAATAIAVSGAVDKALATADTEVAIKTIRAAEVLAFSELRKAEETAVVVLETAEAEAVKVLATASNKAVNVLAMAETMLAFARRQLEESIKNAAVMLKASEELSASELLLVEAFDAHNLGVAQKELLGYMNDHHELLHHMHGGYSVGGGADCTKKDDFEECAHALKETRTIKAATLKQHQADAAESLLRADTASSL
jgi:hypothetical protein